MTFTVNSFVGLAITPELIDNSGQIAAGVINDQVETVALYNWGGTPIDLTTLPAVADNIITLFGMNSSGVVIGTMNWGGQSYAMIWQDGASQLLPALSGDNQASAGGINDFGTAVGLSFARTSVGGFGDYHALIWTNGAASPLSPLGGATGAYAADINDFGQVVGESYGMAASGASVKQAVTWSGAAASALASLVGAKSSWASFLNNSGDIVGETSLADGTLHAVLWHNGAVADLGTPVGYGWTLSEAVNDFGWVVGTASTDGSFDDQEVGAQHAVLWQNGKVIDLNSLLPANSGIVLQDAVSINDAGEILCYGTSGSVTNVSYLVDLNGSPAATVSTAESVIQAVTQGTALERVSFADTAADVAINLDGLEKVASTGLLGTIILIDGSATTLAITDAQLAADAGAWSRILGNFTLEAPSATVEGFSGTASQYDVSSLHTARVLGLQFSDLTAIVAATPGTNSVTTGNVTELYSAVFDREPDVAGLAFYQNYLKSNPGTPLIQFAEWFLSSAEYTANSAHDYAQSTAGDQQFIIDSYQNLLHRTPTAAEIAYYQTNVMAAGGQSHAQMLVYFSASAEFLKDVQITATQPADAQHWLVLT